MTDANLDAADALELAIDSAQHGATLDDDVVTGLLATFSVPVPPDLRTRVRHRAGVEDQRHSRNWLPARVAAATLAWFYFASGMTNIFLGHWLARAVHNAYAPHVYREGGLAFLAVAALVGWAALRPRWLDAAVAVGSPLGVLVAINGAGEIAHLRVGALDHVPELAGALALAFFWWRARRRYQTPGSSEEGA